MGIATSAYFLYAATKTANPPVSIRTNIRLLQTYYGSEVDQSAWPTPVVVYSIVCPSNISQPEKHHHKHTKSSVAMKYHSNKQHYPLR
jgi:hypothetical protein